MSVTSIPDGVRLRIWGKAAGRCEYEGCNEALWLDQLTKAEFNVAYLAHIYADSPGGPRYDKQLSPKLQADISNIMLLCDVHHRLIDKGDVPGHPAARLIEMKRAHEERVERVTGIAANLRTEIVLYGARVGAHDASITVSQAVSALGTRRYPASTSGTPIGLKGSALGTRDDEFWRVEQEQLCRTFDRILRPLLTTGSQHLSVFALAPQPLLVLLGSMLNDIHAVDVYQLHREPVQTWTWDEDNGAANVDWLDIVPPKHTGDKVAAIFSISADVAHERVTDAIGSDVSIWTLRAKTPHNDVLRTSRQLARFRECARELFALIGERHRGAEQIHVFPVMPVATAVELGRVHMPRADAPLAVYDEERSSGGFRFALNIPRE